jgi:hypothetical protein
VTPQHTPVTHEPIIVEVADWNLPYMTSCGITA